MRQTLFYIPHSLGDLPVFGIGWLFYLWLASVAAFAGWTTFRKQWNGDSAGFLGVLLMVGAAIVFVAPRIMEPQGIAIRGYGVMVMIGFVAGVGLAAWRASRLGQDPEMVYSLAFAMFLAGIIGARLFYIIQKRDQFHSLIQLLDFTQGGLVVYGSVIGGLAALLWFTRRRRLPILAVGDLIAPSMLLGLALGRIGCFLNGCCYGGLCSTEWPLGLTFPTRSPPYVSQHQLGQLHGFELVTAGDGDQVDGAPIVGKVAAASPAAKAGLQAGDKIHEIVLPVDRALEAARYADWIVGRSIELELISEQGRKATTVEVRPPTGDERFPENDLGFDYRLSNRLVATVVERDEAKSPANRQLSPGDRIAAVRLPKVATLSEAASLMLFAHETVTLKTDRGTVAWSLDKLPARSLPVHPTQIYSSIGAAALFFFLWVYFPFRRRDGEVFAWMITLYPVGRFMIEIIRDDELGALGTPLTISQLLSIVVFLGALAFWAYLLRRPKGVAWEKA